MNKVARDNFQKWNDALHTKNNKAVAALYSKTDLSFLPTVSPQHIKGSSATEEYFKDFVQKNPSVRVLALSFLVLIGVMLVMEATGQHVSKAYIYAAMAFSLLVQVLNLRMDKRVQKQRVIRELPPS